MLKPYKYLYYRIYAWQLKTWGEEYVPEFNALFLLSLFIVLNLYFVVNLIGYIYGLNILKTIGWGTVHALALVFGITGIGYFILVRDRRYKEIAKQFSKESKGARIRNLVLCVLYVVTTFVLFFGWIYTFPPNMNK